jgi:SAM-dependent methyltransferase
MRRFRDYDPFAWLYTNYWGDTFHTNVMPALERGLLSELKPEAAILDLCCGDGRIAAMLWRRGFRVTGLDGSEQMLECARRRVPDAEFRLGDARDFHFSRRFDAVVSTFDSLNHVMTTAGLNKVFMNVRQCLKRGRIFLFDLNREEAYRKLWSRTSVTVDERCVSVARGSYVPRQRIARCDITLLKLNGGCWTRSDFCLRQRLHQRDAVLRALQSAGFDPRVHDASELGMRGEIGFGRDFFIARAKPGG